MPRIICKVCSCEVTFPSHMQQLVQIQHLLVCILGSLGYDFTFFNSTSSASELFSELTIWESEDLSSEGIAHIFFNEYDEVGSGVVISVTNERPVVYTNLTLALTHILDKLKKT